MISTEQKNEVRQYLIDKKLPIDLLMEVEDHFQSQIFDLQTSKNMSFEEAFNSAIISWHDDLKLKWDGNWSLEDTSDFIKKSTKAKVISLFKKSAIIAGLSYAVLFITYFIIPFQFFRIFLACVILSLSVFPLLLYIRDKKVFDFPRKYKDMRISAFQDFGVIFFTLPLSTIWFFRLLLEMNDGFLTENHVKGIMFHSMLWFYLFCLIFLVIVQKMYLETLRKVIPYLKENFQISN